MELLKYVVSIVLGAFIVFWWQARKAKKEEGQDAKKSVDEIAEKAKRDLEGLSLDERVAHDNQLLRERVKRRAGHGNSQ